MNYSQARKDHEYLWDTYAPASDMTGGYVDQEDLAALLHGPTKTTARQCYERQIEHWFRFGPEPGGRGADAWVTACLAAGHVPIGLILLALQFCICVVPYPWRGPSSRAGIQAPANRYRRR